MVCAYPVVSPRTTRIPAPRSWPDTSSSMRPSSRRAEVALGSGEHFGEFAAATQGRGEGSFEDIGFDHVTFLPPDAPPVFPHAE